jgi:hypothetical protein
MLTFLDYDTDSKAGNLYKDTLKKIRKITFPIAEKEVSITAQHKLQDLYDRHAGIDWPKLKDIFSYNRNNYDTNINLEIDEFVKLINENKHLYYTKVIKDCHPTPLEHLSALKQIINYNIQDSSEIWIESIDKNIRLKKPYIFEKIAPERL